MGLLLYQGPLGRSDLDTGARWIYFSYMQYIYVLILDFELFTSIFVVHETPFPIV